MNKKQADKLKGNILIVDDTLHNLRLLSEILNKQGYQVRGVSREWVAFLTACVSPPDLILLDIILPRMNGFEFCQQLKSDPRTRDIPVIFISVLNEAFDKVKAFAVGGVDYITKPFQVEELLARIENQLRIRSLQKQLTEQNTLLQEEIRNRQRAEAALVERIKLSALNANVGIALTRGKSLQHMLGGCASALCKHLNAAFARIWTLNEWEGMLELQASAGIYTSLNSTYSRIPLGKFKIGWIAQERQPHFTNEVLSDPRIKNKEWAKREGIVAFAGYPLILDNRVVGVMAIFARHQLQETVLQAMASVANGIALGIVRFQAEEILRVSEEKFSKAFGSSPAPISISTLKDGRYIEVNDSFLQLSGYSRQEIIGKSIFDLNLIVPSRKTLKLRHKLQKHGIVRNLEIDYRTKSGEVRTVLLSAEYIDLGGQACVLAVVKDITERRQIQEELRESEERWQLALRGNNDGIWDWNLKTGEVVVSLRLKQIIGYEDQDVFSHIAQWIRSIHPDDFDSVMQARQAHLNKSTPYYYAEYRLRCQDNTYKWILDRGQALWEQQGKPVRMVGSITDISDRQHREEALRLIVEGTAATTGREFFRTCTRYLAQVLKVRCASVTELANEEKTRVRTLAFWTGENFREEFEYELAGTPCKEVLLGLNCYYPSGVEENFPNARNLVNLEVQSYLGIPLVDSAGNILGHLAVMDNIPIGNDPDKDLILRIFAARAGAELERKLAEEALRQSEARERDKASELKLTLEELKRTQAQLIQAEKMSSLGQLLAGVAHEINNPVNFIYGNLTPASQYLQDLLRLIRLYQQSFPNSTPEIRQMATEIDLDFLVTDSQKLISSIKMGAERIRQIVLSLRNFARVDSCELKLVDIHEGIDNTLLILQNRLRAVGNRPEIKVIKEYAPLPKISCYASELNQVLMNLLSNAIDALEHYSVVLPKIEIRTEIRSQKHILHSDSQLLNASSLVIRIADNGAGISEEVQKQIFDPFFTTKPVGSGTGLGLAISYQIIVEKHGGKLCCVSELGQGTEFVVEIPLKSKSVN